MTEKELAIATALEVYERLLEVYEPVAFWDEQITLVDKDRLEDFYEIAEKLTR